MSVPRLSFPPPRSSPPPSHARPLVAGALGAFVGAGLWTAVTALTEYEIGWIAWGVGGLVGFAMSRFTSERSAQLGIYAAVLAVAGLAIGKVATVRVMAPTMGRSIIVDNPQILLYAFAHDMRAGERFSPELSIELAGFALTDSVPPAVEAKMLSEAQVRMDAAAPAERDRVAEAFTHTIMSQVTLVEQFKASLSLLDLLWFGLALATAFRIMRGAD